MGYAIFGIVWVLSALITITSLVVDKKLPDNELAYIVFIAGLVFGSIWLFN